MKKLFACRLLLTILLLVACHLSFVTNAYAAPALTPSPAPCKNPESTELVNNYLLGDKGKPPIIIADYGEIKGKENSIVDLPAKTFKFTVDFSQLQAVFGASNSNYLEGNFQDQWHNQENIMGLNSQDFNSYYKALQKISPKSVIDQQKVDYTKYISGEKGHTLPEAANKYTDINGSGEPKTIYDLVNQFGLPNPSEAGQNQETWNSTWGKYWPKIPTAWSQFYSAEIDFRPVSGDNALYKVSSGDLCPLPINEKVNFVMPEFYRTTAISDQINRQLVAKTAQSYQDHGILNQTPSTPTTQNPISAFFSFCWKLLTSPANIAKEIKKTTSSVIFDSLNRFISPVLAEDLNPSCIKYYTDAKSGNAPYCPLPINEVSRLGAKVSCLNKNDNLKLEKDNPNVVCTFTFQTGILQYQILKKDPKNNSADTECKDDNDGSGNFTCIPKVYIIPNFRIPWLSAIWNNTLISEKDSQTPYQNEANRPGVYSFFTPKSVLQSQDPLQGKDPAKVLEYCNSGQGANDPLCKKLADLFAQCFAKKGLFEGCITDTLLKLPGQVAGASTNAKQQFIGATDCAKHFVRDISLKPLALQKSQKIQTGCDLTASTGSTDQSGGSAPSNDPPNENNCNGLYNLNSNPLHKNFGDPACDFTIEKLTQQLQNLDPSNVNIWLSMLSIESGFNPNAFAAVSTSGTAWGLFQMGHEAYTDLGIPRQMNNEFDRGDVVWSLQAFNAVNYNHTDNNRFCYWEAAFTLGIVDPASCL